MQDAITDALTSLIKTLPVRTQLRVARRVDGWINTVTAMGSLADKVTYTQPKPYCGLSDTALQSMFHTDWIVRKAVSKKPAESLRLGFRVNVPDDAGGQDASTEIQDALDDLNAVHALRLACTWENLYGGAVIFMGLDDGQTALDSQAQPVDWKRVRRVLWLRVLDRRRVFMSQDAIDNDPTSPRFGKPTHYAILDYRTGLTLRVHYDRLIVFPGADTSDDIRLQRQGWGVSIVDWLWEAVQRNVTAWQSAGNAVANAQYVVYKLKGLAQMLGQPEGEEKARRRSRAMEMAKSLINAILIDADDEYSRENPEFGNLPEMLQAFMLEISAAVDIPATVFWGMSPAGMDATGESDLENWYAACDEYREHHLRPACNQLVSAVMSASEGPTAGTIPDGWRVYWPPLYQLSDLEKADVRLKTSQADASDIEAGILLPQEVAKSRFRPEGYCIETQIDIALRETMLKLEIDARMAEIERAAEPPPPPPQLQAGPGDDEQPAGDEQPGEDEPSEPDDEGEGEDA